MEWRLLLIQFHLLRNWMNIKFVVQYDTDLDWSSLSWFLSSFTICHSSCIKPIFLGLKETQTAQPLATKPEKQQVSRFYAAWFAFLLNKQQFFIESFCIAFQYLCKKLISCFDSNKSAILSSIKHINEQRIIVIGIYGAIHRLIYNSCTA